MNLISEEEALKKIKKEIIVFPTDTLFGLLTNAFNKQSVERIYKIKGRDEKKPLLILTDNFNKVKDFLIVKNWHYFFIEEWPESLTLIFEVKDEFKEKLNYLHRGTNKIAVRIPKDDFLLNFLKKLDFPLVAPSANPQGLKPAKNIKEAYEYFKDEVFYLNTDKELEGLPSTIIDLSEFPPKIIREGKKKINFFYFKFKGHPLIRATHKYTFEITKEQNLTEKGTCIIGVEGFSNKEFQEKSQVFKEKKIRYFLFSKNYYDKGYGYLVKVKEPSDVSFVVRRSNFIDKRTGLIKSNKTSYTINRNLIKELKEEKEAFILFKDVKIENLIIDIRSVVSLYSEKIKEKLPKRLKKRLIFEKEKDFFDRDLLFILKKEKMIQNLEVINEIVLNTLEENKEEITNFVEKLKEKFEAKNVKILLRSEFLNERINNFFVKLINPLNVIDLRFIKSEKNKKKEKNLILNNLRGKANFKDLIFSNNKYALKIFRKKDVSTASFLDNYFVDFLL